MLQSDNAYVSGVQEDLNLQGNQLVQLQTMYTLGAVLGQLPFAYLFTKFPMSWLIPFMDVAWGVFTLLHENNHSTDLIRPSWVYRPLLFCHWDSPEILTPSDHHWPRLVRTMEEVVVWDFRDDVKGDKCIL